MKLSSLNKFKGEDVLIHYWDIQTKGEFELIGTVEDVQEDGITIQDEDDNLRKIQINQISSITISGQESVERQNIRARSMTEEQLQVRTKIVKSFVETWEKTKKCICPNLNCVESVWEPDSNNRKVMCLKCGEVFEIEELLKDQSRLQEIVLEQQARET